MPCYLCLQDRPLTKAHVISKHLGELFPELGDEVFHGGVRGRLGALKAAGRWSAKDLDNQVRTICGPCNAGWTQQLDHEAKPIIRDLIDFKEGVLSTSDQATLASWATTVSLVIVSSLPAANAAVSELRRLHVATHHSPPEQTVVWLVAIDDAAGVSGEWSAGHFVDTNDVVANIRFKRVAFQVLLLGDPTRERRPVKDFSSTMHRLWPSDVKPIEWPPTTLLATLSDYTQFMDRYVTREHPVRSVATWPPKS